MWDGWSYRITVCCIPSVIYVDSCTVLILCLPVRCRTSLRPDRANRWSSLVLRVPTRQRVPAATRRRVSCTSVICPSASLRRKCANFYRNLATYYASSCLEIARFVPIYSALRSRCYLSLVNALVATFAFILNSRSPSLVADRKIATLCVCRVRPC
jgi:hypothetical protein